MTDIYCAGSQPQDDRAEDASPSSSRLRTRVWRVSMRPICYRSGSVLRWVKDKERYGNIERDREKARQKESNRERERERCKPCIHLAAVEWTISSGASCLAASEVCDNNVRALDLDPGSSTQCDFGTNVDGHYGYFRK